MMSFPVTDAEGAPAAAPRAGADLRAARERLAWTIEDVAAGLRIRLPYLEALEQGRIDLLPGNAYAVGFLRTYAKALGLDPDEVSRRFKAEASEVNRRTELVFPAPMPQRGVPAGALVLLGVVLAIGAYAGWYRLSGEGRLPAETVTPVPERLASLADQITASAPAVVASRQAPFAEAEPPSAAPNGTASNTAPAPEAVAANNQAAAGVAANQPPPPVLSISPTSAAAAPVPPLAIAPPPGPATAPGTADPTAEQSRITVQATADAWLQVRDRNGGVLFNRVMHSGETWPVPPRPNLVLTTGNAGGTELIVDGATVQVPGGSGVVRRDLPLDPDAIKEGRLAASGPTTPAVPGRTSAAAPRTPGQ